MYIYFFKYYFNHYLLFQMYNIVFWDQYCQIVPYCWVNFREKTFTCPTSKCNATNAIKKKINPANDWKVYTYHKILGPYDSYNKARKVVYFHLR